MALYRFEVHWPSSRKTSPGCVAKAAYVNREQYRDQHTEELTADYSRNHEEELIWSAMFVDQKFTPPDFVNYPEKFWNEVSKASKRSDSQECQDAIGNLPHELTLEQNKRWVTDFIREELTRGTGRVVNVAFHAPSEKSDDRNFHCHMLWSLYAIGPEGFDKKKLPDVNRDDVQRFRERWAHHGARALDKASEQENRPELKVEAERWRAGHLTLEKQREAAIQRGDLDWAKSLDREPQIHMGPTATAMERDPKRPVKTRNGDKNRKIEERNRERQEDRYHGVHRKLPDDIMPAKRQEWEQWLAQHNPNDKFFKAALPVWWGYNMCNGPLEVAGNLKKEGFTLARVTAEDAETSHTRHWAAKRDGRYSPVLKQGEYLAVSDEKGWTFRLHEGTVGKKFGEVARFLKPLDDRPIDSLRTVESRVEEKRIAAIDPTPDGREGSTGRGKYRGVARGIDRAATRTAGTVLSFFGALTPVLTPEQKRDSEIAWSKRQAAMDKAGHQSKVDAEKERRQRDSGRDF